MGIFSFLAGKAAGGVIEATGTAVEKVYSAVKGNKAEEAAAIADEQLATLASHASEFVSRPTRTKFDSFVDGLNRLPRPFIVFWVCGLMIWPYFDPGGFVNYVISLQMVPDELWVLFLTILSFYFGSRVISSDIRKPKLSEAQKKQALDVIREREKVILENRSPLIVEVPATHKPPPPQWARDIINRKPPPFKPRPPIEPQPPLVNGRPPDVDRMIEALIKTEGGFVNDPADSGGATKFGITQTTLSDWRETECTIDDVRSLTKEESAEIYRANYYFKPSIDSLPVALQPHVLDCCTNMGVRGGVKLLQQALRKLGADIKEDGIIGPVTREACSQYDAAQINNTLVELRLKFYSDLAAKRPKDRRFLAGWKKRANSFKVA